MEIGKTYCDEHNSRRLIVGISGGIVTYRLPISLDEERCSIDEFAEWMVGEYIPPEAVS